MLLQINGILLESKGNTLIIYFENENQKKEFETKYVNYLKNKYPTKVVIADVVANKELASTFEAMNYTLIKNFRSLLGQKITTLGLCMEFESNKTRTGKIKHSMYFKSPGINKGFSVVYFDNIQKVFKPGEYYEIKGTIDKDDYFPLKKTDYEIGFQPFALKADEVNLVENVTAFDKHYDKARAELHLHTDMSGKDAFITDEDLVKAAKENKLYAAAITDHGVTHKFPYIQKAIKDKVANGEMPDLKLLFGMEAYMIDDAEVELLMDEAVKNKIKDNMKNINPDIDDAALLNMITEGDIQKEYQTMPDFELAEIRSKLVKDIVNDGKRYHITLLCAAEDSVINYRGKDIAVNESIKEMNKLITHSYLEGFSIPQKAENKYQGKRPCILKSWIMNDTIKPLFKMGSACAFGEIKSIALKSNPHTDEGMQEMYNALVNYDYVEIMPIHNDIFAVNNPEFPNYKTWQDLAAMNKKIYSLVEIWNKNNPDKQKKVIFTSDAHVMDKEEQEIRMWFKRGQISGILKRTDPSKVFNVYDEFKVEDQPYILSYCDFVEELTNQGFTMSEIDKIYNNEKDLVDSLPDGKKTTIIPNFMFIPNFPGVDVKTEVPRLAKEFAIAKWSKTGNYDDIPQTIKERLEYEINATASRNFEFLYYTARHSIKLSNEKGFIVGSRGSVGSSLLAYCLGITENNPLEPHYYCSKCKSVHFVKDNTALSNAFKDLVGWDLPDVHCNCTEGGIMKGDGLEIDFSSFTGFGGDKVPDIDLNFAGAVQNEIQNDIIKTFGEPYTCAAGTIKMFGQDQLKQNILSNIPRIQQHISMEEMDYIYLSKRLQCRESSGRH